MAKIYRQVKSSLLSEVQKSTKVQLDAQYEYDVKMLSNPYYTKKHTIGVTQQETDTYTTAKQALWTKYQEDALAAGLMVEVTTDEQRIEAESSLAALVDSVNQLRAELSMTPISIAGG